MKQTVKLVCLALLACALVLPAFAGGGKQADGDVIKIGVFEPMTGANAAGGAMEV